MMFGFKQRKNEDINRFDFRLDDTKRNDMSMNVDPKWDEPMPFDVDMILGTKPQTNATTNKPKDADSQNMKPMELPKFESARTEPARTELIREAVDREEIEELSRRIENENKNINRRFKMITKNVNQLSLESQELIDLIRLYANANGKFSAFIDEMNILESRGWKLDQNVAALYKFRVGMALANMKKQSANVEKICRKVGFTPSNIKTILNSSIEDLVNSLNGKVIEERKIKR